MGIKGQKNPSVVIRNKENPYWKGKKRPEMVGSKNPVWKGGADKYWQRQAKIRDDYVCQLCGFREIEIMEVDHVLPKSIYPKLRHDLSNLMTLCPNCHRRKTNREKKQILDILREK